MTPIVLLPWQHSWLQLGFTLLLHFSTKMLGFHPKKSLKHSGNAHTYIGVFKFSQYFNVSRQNSSEYSTKTYTQQVENNYVKISMHQQNTILTLICCSVYPLTPFSYILSEEVTIHITLHFLIKNNFIYFYILWKKY